MRPTLLSCLIAVTAGAAQPGDPFKELVRPTDPLSAEQQRATFQLPPGFEIQLVACEPDLRKPMNLQWDSLGRLWVSESREYPFPAPEGSRGRDTVRIFSDFAPDGRAQKVEVFADGLNIPIGIYPFRSCTTGSPLGANSPKTEPTWKCVVWSIPNIWLLEDTDGDGKADKREVLFGPLGWERDTHGNLASFRRGADGWLYGTHGFNNQSTLRGRDGSELSIQSGNTWRVRLDGSRVEGWTWGQVNPFGLCWDERGNLFSADCHSSPIYQLLRGAHYPSFGKPHDGVGFAPQTVTHSHGSTAICGLVYISDPAWPADMQNHMLVGNVQTSRINHDAIHWRGASSKGEELPDFLSTSDPWFRPVDLSWGPDGALYVADFYNRIIGHYEVPLTHPGRDRERGRLWRILHRNPTVQANSTTPNTISKQHTQTAAGLPGDITGWVSELASSNLTRRTLALNELCDVHARESLPTLREALAKPKNAFQKVNALMAFHRLGALDQATLLNALKDPEALVRLNAAKIGAEVLAASQRPPTTSPNSPLGAANGATNDVPPILEALRNALDDADAFVRKAGAEALAVAPAPENISPLLALLHTTPSHDEHLIHCIRIALRNQLLEPAVLSGLAIETHSEQNRAALLDALLAVSGEASALRRLTFFSGRHGVSDAELDKHLRSLSTHLPAEKLDSLVTLAQRQTNGTAEQAAKRIQSLLAGMEQKGTKPGPALEIWARESVSSILTGPEQPARLLQTAAEIVRALSLSGYEEALSRLAFAGDADYELRAAAGHALLSVDPQRFLPLLSPILCDVRTPNTFRQKIAAALAETKSTEASKEILNALRTAPQQLQKLYAAALAGYTHGGESLLLACAESKAPVTLLQDQALLTRLKALKLPDFESRVANLTASLPPANKLLEKLIAERRSAFDPAKTNASHGAGLFERNCAVCHTVDGKGGAIGPQLDGIGGRGPDRLLEDILDPNRNVDRAFRITLVTLKNGSVLAGLPRREDGTQLFLASTEPGAPELRVLKGDIAERKETENSLMPAAFGETLTPEDLNDLVAFLLTKRAG